MDDPQTKAPAKHHALGHSHDVDIIWNFWPFNFVIWIPIGEILNAIIWPITLFTWPLWWTWNFLTFIPMLIGLPLWFFVTFILFLLQAIPSALFFLPSLLILSVVTLATLFFNGIVGFGIGFVGATTTFLATVSVVFGAFFIFGVFVIVGVPLTIITLLVFLLIVLVSTPIVLFILFWMIFFVYLVILVIIVGVLFIPIVAIIASGILALVFGIFILASAILFATPAIVLLVIFFAFFYWTVLFPLGLFGGIILMVSNFTCLFATDKEECEEGRDAEIGNFF